MHRRVLAAAVAALMLPAVPSFAGAQTLATQIVESWNEPGLAGSHFQLAFERWAGNFERTRLGVHLAGHPADSAALERNIASLGNGDFSSADDATLIAFFEVVEASLAVAPVEPCGKFMLDTEGEELIEILAAADSALAEQWVDALEGLVLSSVAPGVVSPPIDDARMQALMIRAMGEMPPELLEKWLRQMESPEALTAAERCDQARLMFRLMGAVPAGDRAAMLRYAFVQTASEEE